MSGFVRARRLSTYQVKRIILDERAVPSREPNLSELISVLMYKADQNEIPVLENNPDPDRSLWGEGYRVYGSLFTIPRLIQILKICQVGKPPLGLKSALQHELDRTFWGLAVMNWESIGGWFKKRIVGCFEPQAIEKHFRSYCFQTNPLLQDRIGLNSLLKLPLRSPESIPLEKKPKKHPIG